jgi:tryptophan 2,3-dioxygenase
MVEELKAWLDRPNARTFPYAAVVAEYHRLGKHFVPTEVLDALVAARRTLPDLSGGDPDTALLGRFLQVALDKRDGRYDYPSYTGLAVLPIPSADDPVEDIPGVLERRDRLVVGLMADAVEFELAAAEGRTELLPEMRPAAHVAEKRCRHALHVARPALERLGLAARVSADDAQEAATQLHAVVQEALSPRERLVLQLSMLPVYVSHDEHLFIRVLQMFETTFALMAVQLLDAVRALADDQPGRAVQRLRVAEETLRESAPLFSLLATMQVGAFQTFRQFTDGASAIQSRNYKILESLCRRPDAERLNSLAYTSTPEVRSRVLAGAPTLDGAVTAACARGRLRGADREELEEAMSEFSGTLLRWRQTHYRVAVRMLGAERGGTGGTTGTAYLSAVRTIDVFRTTVGAGAGTYREAV